MTLKNYLCSNALCTSLHDCLALTNFPLSKVRWHSELLVQTFSDTLRRNIQISEFSRERNEVIVLKLF